MANYGILSLQCGKMNHFIILRVRRDDCDVRIGIAIEHTLLDPQKVNEVRKCVSKMIIGKNLCRKKDDEVLWVPVTIIPTTIIACNGDNPIPSARTANGLCKTANISDIAVYIFFRLSQLRYVESL